LFKRQHFLVFILAFLLFLSPLTSWAAEQDPLLELNSKSRIIYNLIQNNYAGEADFENITENTLKGMVEGLEDPNSVYFTKEELNSFTADVEGSYVGIGISVQENGDYLTITEVFKESPAEKAGIKAGDLILKVDGQDVFELSLEEAVSLIRKEEGEQVELFLQRGSQNFTRLLTCQKIELKVVDYELLSPLIGYISLDTFSERAVEEFNNALTELDRKGARGLIVDLRQNGGGYLNSGLKIASQLIPKGEPIVYLVDKNGKETPYFSFNSEPYSKPVVLLVDSQTASASEIVAGAWQDYGCAVLIGETTYGKGSVQTLFTLPDGSALKLTTAHYLTPLKRAIDGVGITPDYAVPSGKDSLPTAKAILLSLIQHNK